MDQARIEKADMLSLLAEFLKEFAKICTSEEVHPEPQRGFRTDEFRLLLVQDPEPSIRIIFGDEEFHALVRKTLTAAGYAVHHLGDSSTVPI